SLPLMRQPYGHPCGDCLPGSACLDLVCQPGGHIRRSLGSCPGQPVTVTGDDSSASGLTREEPLMATDRAGAAAPPALPARPRASPRLLPRDRAAILAALAPPLAAAVILVPFRADWPNTSAALLLVVVVVAVAAIGNRVAGALAAIGAAAWFDFFLTVPY